jgi:hypothetical protein
VYGKLGSTTVLALPAGAALGAGMHALWHVVAACTLLAAWGALTRLLPRRER